MRGALSAEGASLSSTILLALASVVILGSESFRTHDHILLSQIRASPNLGGPGPRIYILQEQGAPVITPGTVFPFRRLLRLAGLRCRYSNLPLRGDYLVMAAGLRYTDSEWTTHKTPLQTVTPLLLVTQPLPSNISFSGSIVLA
jgi:hypothetical protein